MFRCNSAGWSAFALAWLMGTSCAPAAAAPVTFAFEAEITSIVNSNTGFEFPFEASIGDVIQGRFTFEPSPLGHMGPQDLGLQFEIADLLLASPTYEISISRNQYPPLGSEDLPIDTITVTYSFLSSLPQCAPTTVPGTKNIQWRPFMMFAGETPVLTSYELIDDLDIWNSMPSRSLALHFPIPKLGGGSVNARVGPIAAVPEPSSLLVVALLALSVGVFGHRPAR